jgi:protease I
MFKEGKLVAAICHGPSVLVSANVLKGKKVTCFMSIKDDVMNAGARYKDEKVVVDGNLVTSRSPADLPEFMKAVLLALEK